MSDVKLYGPHYSTYTRSARLVLEEKGVPYDLVEVNVFEGANQQPEHLARQPWGKVPAMSHGDFALYETCAMERYVDEAFEGPALQPVDPQDRARMAQIISVIDSYVYPALLTAVVIQRLVVPLMGGESDEAIITEGLEKGEVGLKALSDLAGPAPFLSGKGPSLADFHLVPISDYFRQTPEGENCLTNYPRLQSWWEAMSARDSVTKTTPKLG
jgi:glutathione S-transferase